MPATAAIIFLVATLALGIVVGLQHLRAVRHKRLVTAHLVLALAATGLVGLLVLGTPVTPAGGPPGVLPLALLAMAALAGWGARRLARRRWPGARAWPHHGPCAGDQRRR